MLKKTQRVAKTHLKGRLTADADVTPGQSTFLVFYVIMKICILIRDTSVHSKAKLIFNSWDH